MDEEPQEAEVDQLSTDDEPKEPLPAPLIVDKEPKETIPDNAEESSTILHTAKEEPKEPLPVEPPCEKPSTQPFTVDKEPKLVDPPMTEEPSMQPLTVDEEPREPLPIPPLMAKEPLAQPLEEQKEPLPIPPLMAEGPLAQPLEEQKEPLPIPPLMSRELSLTVDKEPIEPSPPQTDSTPTSNESLPQLTAEVSEDRMDSQPLPPAPPQREKETDRPLQMKPDINDEPSTMLEDSQPMLPREDKQEHQPLHEGSEPAEVSPAKTAETQPVVIPDTLSSARPSVECQDENGTTCEQLTEIHAQLLPLEEPQDKPHAHHTSTHYQEQYLETNPQPKDDNEQHDTVLSDDEMQIVTTDEEL